MSGIFTHRVCIVWDRALQANVSPAVFFWEWLNYINDHIGLVWKGYGTGKVQTGITPPGSWLNWTKLTAVPWADNSWVVFEAENADPLLNGDGAMPWQCKLQYTSTTAFDDCNVADVNYGKEGALHTVCGRASVMGGWNPVTLDFSPAGGEPASDNYFWWGGTAAIGQNQFFNLEIIGDDDTLYWNGWGGSSPAGTDPTLLNRGGYLGMLQRRSVYITYPFFYKVSQIGYVTAAAGERARNNRGGSYAEWEPDLDVAWPSYSIWKDKTKVTAHRHDTWDSSTLAYMSRYIETGEDLVLAMLVAQWQAPNKYAIIGEYRLIGAVGYDWGFHEVRGTDPQWFQFSITPATYGGIAMRWPVGVVPIW